MSRRVVALAAWIVAVVPCAGCPAPERQPRSASCKVFMGCFYEPPDGTCGNGEASVPCFPSTPDFEGFRANEGSIRAAYGEDGNCWDAEDLARACERDCCAFLVDDRAEANLCLGADDELPAGCAP